VDIPAARAAGVRVANIPSTDTSNAAACAEMALLLTLSLFRDVHAMAASLRERRLGSPTGVLLAGKSALLIGFGSIGRETASRLAALGVRVSAVKRTPWDAQDADSRVLAARGGADDMHRMLVRRSRW
jgi:phosphoglycerate dehydrogenase-like enzyme